MALNDEEFDIFKLLADCGPIKHTGRYKSSVFQEYLDIGPVYLIGDLFNLDRIVPRFEKTYYINTHQLNPSTYLEQIECQSKEECLSRVRKNGKEIRYVKEQSLDLCIEAVKQNVYAFDYVDPKFQVYPLYKVIEAKNACYLTKLLSRKNITMEDLKADYYQLNKIPCINDDMSKLIVSFV